MTLLKKCARTTEEIRLVKKIEVGNSLKYGLLRYQSRLLLRNQAIKTRKPV